MEQGLNSDPDLQLLMTQYVSLKTTFGQAEFVDIFKTITKNDKSIPPQIGAPCAFVFSPTGKHTYCGPPRSNGLQANDELKAIFVEGIKKNGTLFVSASDVPKSSADELLVLSKEIRKLVEEDKLPEAVAKIQPFQVSNDSEDSESPVAALQEMTGVKKTKTIVAKEVSASMRRIKKAVAGKLDSIVDSVQADQEHLPTGLLLMTSLTDPLSDADFLQPSIDKAWLEISDGLDVQELKSAGAKLVEAKSASLVSPEKAKAIYAELAGSKVPHLAKYIMKNAGADPVGLPVKNEVRTWKSKSGTFSVEASLVSFDGMTVVLKKSDGKELKVGVDKLSADDCDFLSK